MTKCCTVVEWSIEDIIDAAKAQGVKLNEEQAKWWWRINEKGFRDVLIESGNEILANINFEGYFPATSEETSNALYEKMLKEQEEYINWLTTQSPEEILRHAYEYITREDILIAMEEIDLTDDCAKALLVAPDSMSEIYNYYMKMETSYMDDIRESIANRAWELSERLKGEKQC